MPRAFTRLTGAPPTYEPFGPPPPEQPLTITPIKDGVYAYSSAGLTVRGYRPKRPSELLCAIAEQYEEKEVTRWGQEVRGGRGKKKTKSYFHAHLTWYGIEYSNDDTRDELEEMLSAAMSTRPPPTLPTQVFEKEAEMRQRFLDASVVEQRRAAQQLVAAGHTIQTSESLAVLSGATSLTDEFFDHPTSFFTQHFLQPNTPHEHTVVLMSVDVEAEVGVYEWACDRYRMYVEKVENDRMTGRNRGRFSDFVIGRSLRAVKAKAAEMRRQNNAAAAMEAMTRFRPY